MRINIGWMTGIVQPGKEKGKQAESNKMRQTN